VARPREAPPPSVDKYPVVQEKGRNSREGAEQADANWRLVAKEAECIGRDIPAPSVRWCQFFRWHKEAGIAADLKSFHHWRGEMIRMNQAGKVAATKADQSIDSNGAFSRGKHLSEIVGRLILIPKK
jgi:hypothetical protein